MSVEFVPRWRIVVSGIADRELADRLVSMLKDNLPLSMRLEIESYLGQVYLGDDEGDDE